MPSQAKLEDSNVANIGGEDHKNAVVNSAKSEAEWKGAGDEIGLDIWRIENFGIKRVDKKSYGTFFSGDSYIVLNTYLNEEKAKRFNVHFWLGESTSIDERGTAAYKTVELDTLLGDLPVQYREVQGHESSKFMKLFSNKVSYLNGGIDSAFKKVKPTEYVARLMHFKGIGKKIRANQVDLKLASLNNGDSFLVDNGLELIIWNGPSCGGWERRKAMEVTQEIRCNRNGRPKVTVLDGDEDHDTFWALLGGKGPVAAAIVDVEEKAVPKTMWCISNSTGSLAMDAVDFKKSALDTNDVFVVDNGLNLYIWIGSGANRAERSNAMSFAGKYLSSHNRPAYIPVTRVIEGAEPKQFFKCFN